MEVTVSKLKTFYYNGFNVIIEGKHGTGKTAMISKCFNDLGINWRYFSAPTMDPWVDFIGIPRAVDNDDGKKTLELVKPEEFAEDTIEALFFDEFNRAHDKVKNAVMELIQFGSINGREFKNLKVVWASINPYDDEGTYDVEYLDPALYDRFSIQLSVPFTPNQKYLKKKHGHVLANAFVEWWNNLPNDVKNDVSPRRLDKAMEAYQCGINLEYLLPKKGNTDVLNTYIEEGSIREKIAEAKSDFTTVENDGNFFTRIRSYLDRKNDTKRDLKKEIQDFLTNNVDKIPHDMFSDVVNLSAVKHNNASGSKDDIHTPNSRVVTTIENAVAKSKVNKNTNELVHMFKTVNSVMEREGYSINHHPLYDNHSRDFLIDIYVYIARNHSQYAINVVRRLAKLRKDTSENLSNNGVTFTNLTLFLDIMRDEIKQGDIDTYFKSLAHEAKERVYKYRMYFD